MKAAQIQRGSTSASVNIPSAFQGVTADCTPRTSTRETWGLGSQSSTPQPTTGSEVLSAGGPHSKYGDPGPRRAGKTPAMSKSFPTWSTGDR